MASTSTLERKNVAECPRCEGRGTIAEGRCPRCDGSGLLVVREQAGQIKESILLAE